MITNMLKFMIAIRRVVFFFKQKTSYELRISDLSSDVCSSDLCTGERSLACPAEFLLHHRRHPSAHATNPPAGPQKNQSRESLDHGKSLPEIGRASCRERVCQYV